MTIAGPITQEMIQELWPNRSSKIYFMSHFKNEEHSAERLIRSVLQVPNVEKVLILLDDSTTDDTETVLRYMQLTFKGKVFYRKFKFQNNFAMAKNECLLYAMEHGLRQGDWCWVLGGDMYVPKNTANKIFEYTSDDRRVIGRFTIPEFHPLKNHSKWWVRALFFWLQPKTRPRLLLWRHRPDIDWDHFEFVHENMFPSIYRLTHMGDFFAAHHGIKNVGTIYHYGQHEDSPEEKKYKIYKYATLWQLWRLVQIYSLKGGYQEVLKQLMDLVCVTPFDRKNAKLGWNHFVEYLTLKYMAGNIPVGLLPLYHKTRKSKRQRWNEYA